jgi:hypothetical protein
MGRIDNQLTAIALTGMAKSRQHRMQDIAATANGKTSFENLHNMLHRS